LLTITASIVTINKSHPSISPSFNLPVKPSQLTSFKLFGFSFLSLPEHFFRIHSMLSVIEIGSVSVCFYMLRNRKTTNVNLPFYSRDKALRVIIFISRFSHINTPMIAPVPEIFFYEEMHYFLTFYVFRNFIISLNVV